MPRPGHSAMAVTSDMPLSLYPTNPEQGHLLSPADDLLYPPWPAWSSQVTESMSTQDNSAIRSLQWEAIGHEGQVFATAEAAPSYTTAAWPSHTDWSIHHQQQFQTLQADSFCPLTNRSAPAASLRPFEGLQAGATRKIFPTNPNPYKDGNGDDDGGEDDDDYNDDYNHNNDYGDDKNDDSNVQLPQSPDKITAGDATLEPNKKRVYRVKNRAAAKRCREKTKQYEIELAAKEKQVTNERIYLDACVTALKNEVLSLKNQILQHGDCDCEIIQGYIAHAANGVSQGVGRF